MGLPTGMPPRLPSAGRQLGQELALAVLLGGNLFGRLAMHPSLAKISDKSERGKVLNASWRRYGTLNSAAVAVLVATWIPQREAELSGLWVSRRDRRLVLAKDFAVGAVVLTGLLSAIGGVLFAGEAPEGGVPLEDGEHTAPEASSRAARLKSVVNALGAVNLGSELALAAVNVAFLQRRTRRLLERP
jgi:hypothetical protein